MENTLPHLISDDLPGFGVPVLVPQDDPQLNPSPIARLFAEKGEVAAEHVIGAAIDELSERLNKAEGLYANCRFSDLARVARSMVGVAEEIGFRGVSIAAAQVSDCSMTRDPAALAATMARLIRMTEQSFAAIWDIEPGPSNIP